MSWNDDIGGTMPREPHPKDRDDWLWVEDQGEWFHWKNERNPLIRVFPPKEGDDRWLVATYKIIGVEWHPTHHQVFEGEGAELRAFIAGDNLVHPLKTLPKSSPADVTR